MVQGITVQGVVTLGVDCPGVSCPGGSCTESNFPGVIFHGDKYPGGLIGPGGNQDQLSQG